MKQSRCCLNGYRELLFFKLNNITACNSALLGVYTIYSTSCEHEICEDRFRTPPALRAFPRNHRRSFTKIDYQGGEDRFRGHRPRVNTSPPRNHRRIFTKMYAKLLQKCGYIRKRSLFSKTALLLS